MLRRTRRHVLASTGAVVTAGIAGCSGDGAETTAPTETTTEPTTDPATEETTTASTTEDDVTQIVVGPNGDFRFAPDDVTVAVGETVEWVWSSGGHNVVAETKPDDSDWEGTEGGSSQTFSSGHAYEHTFQVAGDYTYYCSPHRASGMTGSLTVE